MRNLTLAVAVFAVGLLLHSCCPARMQTVAASAGVTGSTVTGPESYEGIQPGLDLSVFAYFFCDSDSNKKKLNGHSLVPASEGRFMFTPGISFIMQGSKYDDQFSDGNVRLNYIGIPLIARYQTPSGFYAEAGLQPQFLLSAKDKYEGQSYDFKDYVKKVDVGVPVGVGYQTKGPLSVGVRVVKGFVDLNKDPEPGDTKAKNLLFGIRASYAF